MVYNILMNKNKKRWTVIFRAMSNINRIKIVEMLWSGAKISVTDIADSLKISLKSTSNHLAILKNLDVLESHGAEAHVFYFINPNMPRDFRDVIILFI